MAKKKTIQPKKNKPLPKAQNGIEGTMGGLTDKGFNYNSAWGGSFAMGGSLPGAVGFTYARTQGAAPSNGPYAKKTKASAQNGKEMKFYQEGLDFKPKTISKKGSKIIKDPRGQWAHPGEITEIPSNEITMQGVNYPVLGISDTGDTQMMYPNEDYVYEGTSVTEYPIMQSGGRAPIYTDNLNDPRLKSYTDSLNLYKAMQMQDKLMGPGSKPSKSPFKWNTQELKEGRVKKIVKGLEEVGPISPDFQSEKEQFEQGFNTSTSRKEDKKLLDYYKSLGFKPNQIMYHSSPDIVSDKIRAIGSYFDGTALSPIYKKPVQPVEYKKPEQKETAKKKEEVKQQPITEQLIPIQQQSVSPTRYEGEPVYAPTPYSSGAGALVGFKTPQGDTMYIKPEDYQRMGVPDYGREFIEKNSKKSMKDGGSIQDKGQLKKLDQLTNFTNYNNMAKAKSGRKLKKAQQGADLFDIANVVGGAFNTPQIGGLGGGLEQLMGKKAGSTLAGLGPKGAFGKGGIGTGAGNFGKGLAQGAGAAGLGVLNAAPDILKGFGQMKEQKQNIKKADQYAQLTGLTAQAAEMRPEKVKRKYVRPEDTIIQPEQMAPNYGVGSNFLAAEFGAQIGGTPTEIQNMYNPGDLYEDLGYEPLNDTNVKQFEYGGSIPTAEFGDYFQSSGQASIGKGVGSAIGSAFFGPLGGTVGGFLGGVAGNLLGGAQDAQKLRGFQKQAEENTLRAATQQTGQAIQNQYSSFMEDGGYVSNDWTPQVIAKFGDYNVEDLFAPDKTMDTLRSGGHITQNYTFPQDQFQMGGELQTHWGGYAEPISYNPYDESETVMFRGQSHDETNSKGQSGIGVTYGDNPVEVERGEPAVKMRDGGGESMLVFGNMKIPFYLANQIGDKNAKGKKFKNYINDLSNFENKQNKLTDKTTKQINDLEVSSPTDNLTMNSYQANLIGANMNLKNAHTKKKIAAMGQNAILDTAEEYGLESDALARGQIKKAKFGAKMETAQTGKIIPGQGNIQLADQPILQSIQGAPSAFGVPEDYYGAQDVVEKTVDDKDYNYLTKLYQEAQKAKKGPVVLKFQKEFHRLMPEKAKQVLGTEPVTAFGKQKGFSNIDLRSNLDSIFGKRTKQYNAALQDRYKTSPMNMPKFTTPEKLQYLEDVPIEQPKPQVTPGPEKTPEQKQKFNWEGLIQSGISNVMPLFRPTNQRPVDPRQFMEENLALATNQLEPVQAQSYKPLLEQPFDISLQDQLNANQADFNAIQRIAGNNPAALSALAAQKYGANSGVLGNQFRMNQAERAGVYNRNRATLNDAQLKNLSLYDQQYVRQAQAKANTKDVAQAALSSIADKIAKNELENRTLGVSENLYDYRFGPKGQAINYNDPRFFNMQGNPFGNATAANQPPPGYEYEMVMKKKKEEKSRNGSIVKAIKNL